MALVIGAAASGGRFIPQRPNLGYNGVTAGQFTIGTTGSPAVATPANPYDSTFTYSAPGGTLAGATVFVSDTSGVAVPVTAQSVKGVTPSSAAYAYRQQRTYTTTYYPYNQCGGSNCNNSVNPNMWQCGGACPNSGGGAWGYCVCRGPSFTQSSENSYAPSGFTYNGTTTEWWKVSTT